MNSLLYENSNWMFSFVHSARIAKILCRTISVLNKVKAIVCVCVGRWFNSVLGAKLPYGNNRKEKSRTDFSLCVNNGVHREGDKKVKWAVIISQLKACLLQMLSTRHIK